MGMSFQEGYLIIATGPRKYYQMAVNLAKSIWLKDGKRRICLANDDINMLSEKERKLFTDFHNIPNADATGVEYKIESFKYSPFETTMFVDADILMIKDDIDYFWERMAGKAFVFAGNMRKGGFWRVDIKEKLEMLGLNWCASGNLGCYVFDKSYKAEFFFECAQSMLDKKDVFSTAHTKGRGYSIEPVFGLCCGLFGLKPYPTKDKDGKELHLTTIKGKNFDFDFHKSKALFNKGPEKKEVNPTLLHFPGLKLDGDDGKSLQYKKLVSQIDDAYESKFNN